jgi:hypothetical protein
MDRAGSATDAEAIRLQLERILSSGVFGSARRSQAFLRYVVEKSILGPIPKEYEIAVDVFERSADYDPAGEGRPNPYRAPQGWLLGCLHAGRP